MLEMLGRCEHFDVVIVDDISSVVATPLSRLVAALVNLGDHVFMLAESESYEAVLSRSAKIKKIGSNSSALFLSNKPKKGLDLARYTQKKDPSKKGPRYKITSTFRKKEFIKKGLRYPTRWISGINLVTFTMLYGVYPADAHLRREIRRLRKTCFKHNDFVIGNILLQGNRLIPIDFSDIRRNANFYDCVESVLKAFKRGNYRLENPHEWIADYYEEIP